MPGKLAVDLGTARTRLADEEGKVILDEPSVAAVDLSTAKLLSYGAGALKMIGASAGQVGLERPVVHGQLQDLELTDQVARHLLSTAVPSVGRRPEVLMTLPGLATAVQKRALERSFKAAGAQKVELVEAALAVGVGFRLHIEEPVATMVVDVGAGTTEVAVMALGGVVAADSVPVGGGDLDAELRSLLFRSFDLVVPRAVAEEVKLALVSLNPVPERKIEVHGRDASNGRSRSVVLSTSEATGAVRELIDQMVLPATRAIVAAPPDLANDLLTKGLYLAGGGALLDGFAEQLAEGTGIPVHLAAEPGTMALEGAARLLRGSRPLARRST